MQRSQPDLCELLRSQLYAECMHSVLHCTACMIKHCAHAAFALYSMHDEACCSRWPQCLACGAGYPLQLIPVDNLGPLLQVVLLVVAGR